jgi:hypothetical protein
MSQIAMSSSTATPRTSPANYNFAISATLLAFAVILIAAQLIFVGNNPEAIRAAADAAAFGIISP